MAYTPHIEINVCMSYFVMQIRLVVEEGLNQLPYTKVSVTTPTGKKATILCNILLGSLRMLKMQSNISWQIQYCF